MARFLIVDDEESWRQFHAKAIQAVKQDVYIDLADSAKSGYDKVLENIKTPYDYVLTDMQMESDYLPKLAGEWFIEQIKTLNSYFNTKIVIISASPKIKLIAENYNVDFIPKRTAVTTLDSYKAIL